MANYRYDAYGSIISVTDANGNYISSATHIANLNPFRYRGYMYDEESGFYYLRSRYYDSYIGRFLNADGTVYTGVGFDGFNMFAYCNGNPINLTDYSGNRPVRGTDACGVGVSSSTNKDKEAPKKSSQGTYATGQNFTFSIFTFYVNVQVGVIGDTKGNVGITGNVSGGTALSLKGFSSTSYHTVTNAEDIYMATESIEYQTGGSVGFMAGPVPAGAAVDYLSGYDENGNLLYTGISSGPGVSTPGAEIHRTTSEPFIDTRNCSFNLFEWVESWFTDDEEGKE